MANYQAAENAKISVTTADQAATFDGGVNQVYLVCDADCFISFDQPATTGSMLLKANFPPFRFTFEEGGTVKQVHAITSTGTANLYIMGIRS